jgi:anti-anti-sigma factor
LGITTDRLSLTEFDGRPGIAVNGELDEASAGELDAALRQLGNGGGPVYLDLYGCTFMDSKGLDVIVRAAMRLWDEGGQLVVHNASGPVRQLFRTTGLTSFEGLVLHRDVPG